MGLCLQAGAAGARAAGTRAAVEGEGSLLEDKSHAGIWWGLGGGGLCIISQEPKSSISRLPLRIWFSTLEEQLQMKDLGL